MNSVFLVTISEHMTPASVAGVELFRFISSHPHPADADRLAGEIMAAMAEVSGFTYSRTVAPVPFAGINESALIELARERVRTNNAS